MANDLRSPFFEAAFTILGSEGYAGLKQAALCRSVGVTTGAFYHSFTNWKDFTGQLLEHWHQERTTRLVELAHHEPDPIDQLAVLLDATISLPHRAEAAIRVWSELDPEVARVQDSVDAERFIVIHDAFLELVGDPAQARRHAHAGMWLLVGYEQHRGAAPEHLEWALRMLLDSAAAARTDARRDLGFS